MYVIGQIDHLRNLCVRYFRPLDILCYIKYLIELDVNRVFAGINKQPRNRSPYGITISR